MNLRQEFRPMLRLAAPLALAELGWMAMAVVDTIMVGPLGAAAVGASSLGGSVFYPIGVVGTGLLLGMDTLVAQSFGARDPRDCRRTLVDGCWLALGLSPVIAAALAALVPLLSRSRTNPHVLGLFVPYFGILVWSIVPLLFYTAFRRYLQAVDIVKPVTFALLSANLVNFAGNWLLIYGHWGLPRMGLAGSALSTLIARCYMAAVLFVTILLHERRSGNLLASVSWRPDFARIRRLLALGLPAAAQLGFEGAVFAFVSVMAARLDEVSLAAHSIALQVIATTYMVPLGISSAAAVRVGQAAGRQDPAGASASGWASLLFSTLFMCSASVVLIIVPGTVVRGFMSDPAVIAAGVLLLRIAAIFEIFDGLQITATGALRGLGNTRTSMLLHFGGYWFVGLPIAYLTCFRAGIGVTGIWLGLTAAVLLIGSALVAAWWTELRKFFAANTLKKPTTHS
jgi:MATE family multidrug resistance protein